MIDLPGKEEVAFGILLLVLNAERFQGKEASCYNAITGYYPKRIVPFADDTGGNYWTFDFRANAAEPSMVFINHEVAGEEGVTRAADNFAAFMAAMGTP